MQRKELEAVLSRIATKSCNIPGEYEIASRTLGKIICNESQERVKSFLLGVRHAFSVFYSVTTKDKTNRVIQIEQNFFRNKSERLQIEEMWDELVGPATTASIVDGEKHSRTVM